MVDRVCTVLLSIIAIKSLSVTINTPIYTPIQEEVVGHVNFDIQTQEQKLFINDALSDITKLIVDGFKYYLVQIQI